MYLKIVSKNIKSFSIFITLFIIISVIQHVVEGKYLQHDKIGVFNYKSALNDYFNDNIDTINKNVLSHTLNEVRPYLINPEEMNYDNENVVLERASRSMKPSQDSNSHSNLRLSRCYFNPVSC
uniref:Fam-b protein n=1 Tax=Strongyloides stercoralis TaxID=6248 RepID=A0A0K0E1F9_STRER